MLAKDIDKFEIAVRFIVRRPQHAHGGQKGDARGASPVEAPQ